MHYYFYAQTMKLTSEFFWKRPTTCDVDMCYSCIFSKDLIKVKALVQSTVKFVLIQILLTMYD